MPERHKNFALGIATPQEDISSIKARSNPKLVWRLDTSSRMTVTGQTKILGAFECASEMSLIAHLGVHHCAPPQFYFWYIEEEAITDHVVLEILGRQSGVDEIRTAAPP